MLSLQERKAKEKELDDAAIRWKSISPEGNQGTLDARKNDVFLMAFKLYDHEDQGNERDYDPNIFLNALMEALDRYTPEAGKFSHYLSLLLSGRKKDAYRYDMRHAPTADSLDRPVTMDENETLGDVLPAAERFEPESTVGIDSLLAELTAMILKFSQRKGKSNNSVHKMWYHMFYTEDMTQVMKEHTIRFVHERDIFEAMDTAYLDYYMSAPCRTGKAVMDTPLKPYCQAVPTCTDTAPIPVPIPADVSLCYLETIKGITVGRSTRSNHLNMYKKEKKMLLTQ